MYNWTIKTGKTHLLNTRLFAELRFPSYTLKLPTTNIVLQFRYLDIERVELFVYLQ